MEFSPKVLLGIPDEVILPENDLYNTWSINKFGGIPNWLQDAPANYPQCSLCNAFLPLVVQIYCPLEKSLYHRVLYIFGCTNSSCWNKKQSWKVLRCQKLDHSTQEVKVEHVEDNDIWCDDADDWGDECSSTELPSTNNSINIEQLEKQTEDLSINENNSRDTSNNLRTYYEHFMKEYDHFVPYYITVVEETLSETNNLSKKEQKLLVEYQKREGCSNIEDILDQSSQSGEKYEQSFVKHEDKIFQKFLKQVHLCPEQCLRYSLHGKPLLMTADKIGAIPHCPSCGRERIFEIQLMPALVLLLKLNQKYQATTYTGENVVRHTEACNPQSNSGNCSEKSIQGSRNCGSQSIEFGTVYIFTCSNNCWTEETSFHEEYIVVHSEPDHNVNFEIK